MRAMLVHRILAFANVGAEWVLWLLVVLSVASVSIMIERARFFAARAKLDVDLLLPLLLAGEFAKAREAVGDGPGVEDDVAGTQTAEPTSVEDNGCGMSETLQARVFEPFFTTKEVGKGTGLGLSVTRTIAEANGGELSFDFPERGTVATLWLPEAPPEHGPGFGPGETPPPGR